MSEVRRQRDGIQKPYSNIDVTRAPKSGLASLSGDRSLTRTLRAALDRDSSRLGLSSGSVTLDELLESGFRTGQMVEVYGESATAKTQLGLQSALLAAAEGFTSAYVDTEGQFRPERIQSMCLNRGLDPEKILPLVYCFRAEDTRKQLEAIPRFGEELEGCRMVVVDTVTKNFTLEFPGARLVPTRQAALGAYLNRLARDAYSNDRAVLLLNRVASTGTGEASREVDIGGETLRHFVQRAIHLSRRGTSIWAEADEGSGRAGVTLKITDRGLE